MGPSKQQKVFSDINVSSRPFHCLVQRAISHCTGTGSKAISIFLRQFQLLLYLLQMNKIGRVTGHVNWEWEEEIETLKMEHVAFRKY